MKVLVDAMNIVFIEYSIARKKMEEDGLEFNEENVGFFYHVLINKLNTIFSTYSNLIFCWEGVNSTAYRKGLFPGYKENRKESRNEDEYKVLKTTFNTIKELLNFYPCKQISVDECEGDDVIYSLCDKYSSEDRIVVLSGDGDFAQLGNQFDNVMVYNPIMRRETLPKKDIVKFKAIVGDPSDGIPGLYRVGMKTFEKMIKEESEWEKVLSKDGNKKLYDIFTKVVDLSLFPVDKRNEIKEIEGGLEFNLFSPDDIEGFLWKYKLKDLLKRWGAVKNEIYSINSLDRQKNKVYYDEEEEKIDKIFKEFF